MGIGDSQLDGVDPESALICCMVLCPSSCEFIFELLDKADFSSKLHAFLYIYIEKIHRSNTALNPLSLRRSLQKSGNYGAICGPADLAGILTCLPTASPKLAESYAKMILDSNR